MENKKIIIILAIFLIGFSIIKNFASPKIFVLFIVLLPFILILIGYFSLRKNN